MKNKPISITIPKGWRRLRSGVFVKKGDMYINQNNFNASFEYTANYALTGNPDWKNGAQIIISILERLLDKSLNNH